MYDPDHPDELDDADDRDELDRWISTGDLDELIREIDRSADRDDWARVLQVRDRARAETERGHQLWPAASYAEYRTALDAAPELAASVVVDGAGFLAPGPLSEVAAQSHTWDQLSRHLATGPARSLVLQERVVRGEDLTAAATNGTTSGELPARLLPWEPGYALAEYRADRARFPLPDLPVPNAPVVGAEHGECGDGRDGARALEDAVRHWAAHSDGTVRAICVEGKAADAIATITAGHAALARPIGAADAVSLLAWAGASGGSRGRRRGMAAGRFEAWWALATVLGIEEDWPIDPGPDAEDLDWYVWAPREPTPGWVCRIAVADPVDGLAWALDATDRALDP